MVRPELRTTVGERKRSSTDIESASSTARPNSPVTNSHLPAPAGNVEKESQPSQDSPLPSADTQEPTQQRQQMDADTQESLQQPHEMESSSSRLVRLIHAFIDDERRRSFTFLGAYSHLYMRHEDLLVLGPATPYDIETARGLYKNNLPEFNDDHFFVFTELMGSLSRLIVVNDPNETDIDRIAVVPIMTSCNDTGSTIRCSKSESIPVGSWLQKTYSFVDDARMRQPETQYEEQQLWWDAIPKVFPLMNLPPELREQVYLHAIGPVVLPDIYGERVTLGRGLAYKGDRTGRFRDPDIAAPNLAIMRVSKLVQAEATAMANRDSFKRLRSVGAKDNSIAKRQPSCAITALIPALRNMYPAGTQAGTFLRNIQLEMSAVRYFAFIGITPAINAPFSRMANPGFNLNDLRNFRGLQNLDFRFISPKHPDAACPWAVLMLTHDDGQHSCQKKWIDWWFTLAWIRLKVLQNRTGAKITLSGCVKTSSKQYWEQALADKTNKSSAEITTRVAGIQQGKTGDLPITCDCSYPCSRAASTKAYVYDEYEQRQIVGLQGHLDDDYWNYRD